MISNRHRGLVELHNIGTLLAVGVFFWLYANLIYHVPYVRLSKEFGLRQEREHVEHEEKGGGGDELFHGF